MSRSAAAVMPTCHCTTDKRIDSLLSDGALLSNHSRGVQSRPADIALEATNDICFYLGSAAFPANEYAFLFAAGITDNLPHPATSTPFDSGGCIRRYPMPRGIEPLSHVRAHTTPVPQCREYLGDLLSSHFSGIRDYLEGREFCCPVCGALMTDPHGMLPPEGDREALIRMHEIRIPGRVGLTLPALVAVFVPENNVSPAWAPLLSSGVRFVFYEKPDGKDSTRALRKASVDFIRTELLN